jgi:hypothetical protein
MANYGISPCEYVGQHLPSDQQKEHLILKELRMQEDDLLELWNAKRFQIIAAQVAPALVLLGVFVLAAFGQFENASDGAKYLAIGATAATGILAVITQYATIREAEALLIDLKKIENKSALATKIASSRGFLSIMAIILVGLSLISFALVLWAVLG